MSESKIESLAEALPREITRCEKLVEEYKTLGSVGEFARMHIEADLREARAAVHAWDASLMYLAYLKLREKE